MVSPLDAVADITPYHRPDRRPRVSARPRPPSGSFAAKGFRDEIKESQYSRDAFSTPLIYYIFITKEAIAIPVKNGYPWGAGNF
jgi:hypothetical protein